MHTKVRHILSALLPMVVTIGGVAIADPASAAPPARCTQEGFSNGRTVTADNAWNGNGAVVRATLCWQRMAGTDLYHTKTWYSVTDNARNGAGATIYFHYNRGDRMYDYVPPVEHRAWEFGETVSWVKTIDYAKNLYVVACLTNADRAVHHCGNEA
ncbi:hypothetical protein ACGF7U_28820 [Micromonospora sp. NPDC047670]|uniref:hypothetical protein n=1 Tax=Micromonospora sp. NPDC047670 TaxID=3364252 RepID=UPI003720AD27